MKCSQVQTSLSEYLDGGLGPVQGAHVREHLDHCEGCAAQWRALRQTVRLVAHLGNEKCPVDLRASVALAVQERTVRAARRPLFLSPRVLSGGGAFVAAATVLTGFVLLKPQMASGTLPRNVQQVQAAVAAQIPVHDQYNLATGLGTTDGLLLSLTPDAEGAVGELEPAEKSN